MRRPSVFVCLLVLLASVGFLFVYIVLSTVNILSSTATSHHRSSHVRSEIKGVRIFPQGGEQETFNQPWKLEKPELVTNFGTDQRFLFSNFSYSKGLGNLMFQLASLHSLAKSVDAKIVIDESNLLRRSFQLLPDVLITSANQANQIIKEEKGIEVQNCCAYEEVNPTFRDGKAVVNGYFQSWRYFHPYMEQKIRNMFYFLPEVRNLAAEFLRNRILDHSLLNAKQTVHNPGDVDVLTEDDPFTNSPAVIGVHVRRGADISMNTRNMQHGHVSAPEEYYKKAMHMAKAEFQQSIFVICSDNPRWVKMTFKEEEFGPIFLCPGIYREVDMAILTRTDALIISTGTFSWWSGYLNDNTRKIYYYNGWPRPGSDMDRMLNKTEYFLDHWTPVDV